MSTRLFREDSPWQTWAKIWSSILWFKPMHAWRIQAARIEAARIESPRIQAVRIQTARIQTARIHVARIETIWGWKQDVGGEFRRRDAQCRFLRRWHNWSGRLQSQSSTSSTSALSLGLSDQRTMGISDKIMLYQLAASIPPFKLQYYDCTET